MKNERQISMNSESYKLGFDNFGFEIKELDKYGWLKQPDWIDVIEVEFKTDKENYAKNKIKVGRGVNGNWTTGIYYSAGKGGGASGLHITGNVFKSKKDAMDDAIDLLLRIHKKHNDSYSNEIIDIISQPTLF